MSALYDRLRGTAGGLLSRYNQGVIEFQTSETVSGDDTTISSVSRLWQQVNGVAFGVSQKYIGVDGIVGSDIEITTQAPIGFSVEVGDYMRLDGKMHQIMKWERVPATGTPVYDSIIVKG